MPIVVEVFDTMPDEEEIVAALPVLEDDNKKSY